MTSKAKPEEMERPLPSNPEAERSVLGAVLLDNASLVTARALLQPEDFQLRQHTLTFFQMLELHDRNEPIDLVTLTESLHGSGELEAAGGAPYLAALADGMPRVSNIEHYANIVKEKAILRNLIHATHQIQERAFEGTDGVTSILDNARSTLTALINSQPSGGFVPMKTLVHDNFERIEKIFSEGRMVTGLPTGYGELDKLTAGLQPGELIILAARPSHGKTALALNIAENVSIRLQQPVGFCSLEMSKESLLSRLLAAHARINAHKFRTGHLSKDDWQKLLNSLGELSQAPLWVDDASSATLAEIGARAERLKQERGLSLLVVDYLQLVSASRYQRSRQEEVSAVSRGLKALAKDLAVPVLALSQLTRAPDKEERAPMLSDLRESGAIEQDADVVMFIHRPGLYQKGADPVERDMADIIVAKQRNGPTDTVPFIFMSTCTRFEERAPDFTFGDPV